MKLKFHLEINKKLKILVVVLVGVITLSVLAINSFQNSTLLKAPVIGSFHTDNQEMHSIMQNTGSENFFIDNLRNGLQATAGIFDNFIAFTPDPTGKIKCQKVDGSFNCTLLTNVDTMVTFPVSEAEVPSTTQMAANLAGVAYLIGVLLICIQGYTFIINPDKEEFRTFMLRIASGLVMAILTPFIMSASIALVNLFSSRLLGSLTLTDYLSGFVNSLEATTVATNFFQQLYNNTIGSIASGTPNLLSYLAALPVIIPMGMVLLLLLYLSFQFIIRFLYLYFLAAIYPIIAVFALHPKTQSIIVSYWQQWSTFIIQQPVFIIGFVLMKDVMANLFNQGLSLEAIVIFIGLLLFLCTINLLAARLWGDVYAVVAQNVTAAMGANILKSAIIDKPLQYGSQMANIFSVNKIGAITPDPFSKAGNPTDTKAKDKTNIPGISGSPLANELRGSGCEVYDKGNGLLNVSGNFFTDKNAGIDTTTALYTSPQSALKDGIRPESIQQISLKDLTVQDSSNKKMMNQYNAALRQDAADNAGHAKGIGLGYRSNDEKVYKNMEIGKAHNLNNGVQAVGVKSEGLAGDSTITGDNILKIHAYSEVVNNKK